MYSLAGRQHDLLTRFEPMDFCWLSKVLNLAETEVSDPSDAMRPPQEYVGREIAEEEGGNLWVWKSEHRKEWWGLANLKWSSQPTKDDLT